MRINMRCSTRLQTRSVSMGGAPLPLSSLLLSPSLLSLFPLSSPPPYPQPYHLPPYHPSPLPPTLPYPMVSEAHINNAEPQIWNSILTSRSTSLLTHFLIITFADLKKYKYYYWFAFPAFTAKPAWEIDGEWVGVGEGGRFDDKQVSFAPSPLLLLVFLLLWAICRED